MGCTDGGTPDLGRPAGQGQATGPERDAAYVKKSSRFDQKLAARVRMKFTKSGRLRFLSHLDLMTLFQRAAVRAEIPLAFSQGFNPHPKISFGPAISVGIESDAEYLDLETAPTVDLLVTTKTLNNTLPEGIRILEARMVSPQAPSLSGSIGRYCYGVVVPEIMAGGLEERIASLLAQTAVIIVKDGKQKDIRPCIESMTATRQDDSAMFSITLIDLDPVRPRVQDVVHQLFAERSKELHLLRIRRTAMYCKDSGKWKSPMDIP
jgi:radical SAM-linked protein